MPAYSDPADTAAQRVLVDCFPAREVIPVNCVPLIYQSGSLHCAALQLPGGVLQLHDGQ
jgi:agmatine/peptidylarginine deiminase